MRLQVWFPGMGHYLLNYYLTFSSPCHVSFQAQRFDSVCPGKYFDFLLFQKEALSKSTGDALWDEY